jgi:hypothetical protein
MAEIISSYIALESLCKAPFKEFTGFDHTQKPELFFQYVNNVQNQALIEKLNEIQTVTTMILNNKTS